MPIPIPPEAAISWIDEVTKDVIYDLDDDEHPLRWRYKTYSAARPETHLKHFVVYERGDRENSWRAMGGEAKEAAWRKTMQKHASG